ASACDVSSIDESTLLDWTRRELMLPAAHLAYAWGCDIRTLTAACKRGDHACFAHLRPVNVCDAAEQARILQLKSLGGSGRQRAYRAPDIFLAQLQWPPQERVRDSRYATFDCGPGWGVIWF